MWKPQFLENLFEPPQLSVSLMNLHRSPKIDSHNLGSPYHGPEATNVLLDFI
jgi:hypothetical protein